MSFTLIKNIIKIGKEILIKIYLEHLLDYLIAHSTEKTNLRSPPLNLLIPLTSIILL